MKNCLRSNADTGEARRVATLAKPLRGGKRIPIYPYADALWNAEWGHAARSQYLNASAMQSTLMREAMTRVFIVFS